MHFKLSKQKVLGLNPKELQIIEHLERQPHPLSISSLSRGLPLPRTTIGYIVGLLVGRGLITEHNRKRRKIYSVAKKEKYLEQIYGDGGKETRQLAESIDKQDTDQFCKIYVGLEDVISAYMQIPQMEMRGRIKAIQPQKSASTLFSKIPNLKLIEFNNYIKDNKLILEGVTHPVMYKNLVNIFKQSKYFKEVMESFADRSADYALLPIENLNHNAEIWIYKKELLIINWEAEFAIKILNKDVVSFVEDMFDYTKAFVGQKTDHNLNMKKIISS